MGEQPGRHTDWLCNQRGSNAETGIADKGRADIGTRIRQVLSKAWHRVSGKGSAREKASHLFAHTAVWLQRWWRWNCTDWETWAV